MTCKCPTCGTDLANADRPLVSLQTNKIMSGGEIIQLSPREAEIAHILVEAMPLPVATERMLGRLYGGRPTDSAYDAFKVYIHTLRKKIAQTNLVIETLHRHGHAMTYRT